MSKSWPKVRLGEVLRPVARPLDAKPDEMYREIGIRSHGKGVFHKAPVSGLELGGKRVFWMQPGDFVLNIVFAWEGAVAVLSEAEAGMIGSHRFPTFRADEPRLDSRFLLAYLKTHEGRALLGKVSPGGAGRNRTLSKPTFLHQLVPLPPLAQQRRAVAQIEELSAQIHEAHALRQQAAKEAEALTAAGLRAIIGEIPSPDWQPLGSLVSRIENGKSPQCESRPAEPGEWGVLKVGAISFGTFDARENKALPLTMPVLSQYEVKRGDFLMSRANTPDLCGACVLVRETRPRLLLSDKTFRFHFRNSATVERVWLDYVLKSPAIRAQIVQSASGTSPTMKNISKDKVLALRIPPHSLAEQRRIVAELDLHQTESNELKRLQAETAAELAALLPALLDRAFHGEL